MWGKPNQTHVGTKIFVERINKFMEDKAFIDSNDYIFITEGYLLNKVELLKETGTTNVADMCQKLYISDGYDFISGLRGCFSGMIYEKKKK